MRNKKTWFKIIFITIVSWSFLSFNINVCGLTQIENNLLTKIKCALSQEKVDEKKDGAFSQRIAKENYRDITYQILKAPVGEIGKRTISKLIEKSPYAVANALFILSKEREDFASYIYAAYIRSLGNCGANPNIFREAQDVYKDAVNKLIIDDYIYAAYIYTSGRNNRMDEATRIFIQATSGPGEMNPCFYNVYVAAARNNNQNELVDCISAKAKNIGAVDAYSHSARIMAAGLNDLFDEAKKIFAEATADPEKSNSHIYNAYISIQRRNNNITEIDKAYDEAVNRGKTDPATYNIYSDILMELGQIERAVKIFLDNYTDVVISYKENDLYYFLPQDDGMYDFHGLGFGAAYVAIYLLMAQTNVNNQVAIIVGKGLHSRDENIVRSAVKTFVSRSKNTVKLYNDRYNGGVVFLTKIDDEKYSPDMFLTGNFSYKAKISKGESHWIDNGPDSK